MPVPVIVGRVIWAGGRWAVRAAARAIARRAARGDIGIGALIKAAAGEAAKAGAKAARPGGPPAEGPAGKKPDDPEESAWERWLRRITKGGNLLVAIGNVIPRLEDEVIVEVAGEPGSTKQELYLLALAAANGVVRRFSGLVTFIPPTMAVILIEYDAADAWVRCTIRYVTGTAGANVQTGARKGSDFFDALAVYRGPQCSVIGGDFDFLDTTVGLLPGVPNEARAPGLPFAHRQILTSCPNTDNPAPNNLVMKLPPKTEEVKPSLPVEIPSPNPKPPGDNRSRGGVVAGDPLDPAASFSAPSTSGNKCCPTTLNLIQLVFSALANPGSFDQEVWRGPTAGPPGAFGMGG